MLEKFSVKLSPSMSLPQALGWRWVRNLPPVEGGHADGDEIRDKAGPNFLVIGGRRRRQASKQARKQESKHPPCCSVPCSDIDSVLIEAVRARSRRIDCLQRFWGLRPCVDSKHWSHKTRTRLPSPSPRHPTHIAPIAPIAPIAHIAHIVPFCLVSSRPNE